MSLTDPESAREREQLGTHVEEHPEQPEVALAKHLLALRPHMDRPKAGAGPELQSSNEKSVMMAPNRRH